MAGPFRSLFFASDSNFVDARDPIVEAVEKKSLPLEALDNARRRIDEVLAVATEYEHFNQDEFDAVSSDTAKLKRALDVAETEEEYAPTYGDAEGSDRRSSNF